MCGCISRQVSHTAILTVYTLYCTHTHMQGAPVSYLFVIPFVFWNVDEELGRSAMVLWALGYPCSTARRLCATGGLCGTNHSMPFVRSPSMYLTSFAKDLLLLPQPHQVYTSPFHACLH